MSETKKHFSEAPKGQNWPSQWEHREGAEFVYDPEIDNWAFYFNDMGGARGVRERCGYIAPLNKFYLSTYEVHEAFVEWMTKYQNSNLAKLSRYIKLFAKRENELRRDAESIVEHLEALNDFRNGGFNMRRLTLLCDRYESMFETVAPVVRSIESFELQLNALKALPKQFYELQKRVEQLEKITLSTQIESVEELSRIAVDSCPTCGRYKVRKRDWGRLTSETRQRAYRRSESGVCARCAPPGAAGEC